MSDIAFLAAAEKLVCGDFTAFTMDSIPVALATPREIPMSLMLSHRR